MPSQVVRAHPLQIDVLIFRSSLRKHELLYLRMTRLGVHDPKTTETRKAAKVSLAARQSWRGFDTSDWGSSREGDTGAIKEFIGTQAHSSGRLAAIRRHGPRARDDDFGGLRRDM